MGGVAAPLGHRGGKKKTKKARKQSRDLTSEGKKRGKNKRGLERRQERQVCRDNLPYWWDLSTLKPHLLSPLSSPQQMIQQVSETKQSGFLGVLTLGL